MSPAVLRMDAGGRPAERLADRLPGAGRVHEPADGGHRRTHVCRQHDGAALRASRVMARSASPSSRATSLGGTASSARRHGHDRHDAADRDGRGLGPGPGGRREGHRPGHRDGRRHRLRRRHERPARRPGRRLRDGHRRDAARGTPRATPTAPTTSATPSPTGPATATTAVLTVTVANAVPAPAPVAAGRAHAGRGHPGALPAPISATPGAPAQDKDAPRRPRSWPSSTRARRRARMR